MESLNSEEIITEQIKTEMQIQPSSESSFSYEEFETIIPAECPVVKIEEFNSVTDIIKHERAESIAEQFETVYIKPPELYENNKVQRSENRLRFSKVFSDEPSALLCRLCATQSNDMVHIFGTNELHENIMKKIEHCLPIMVRETDTLPKQACRTCLAKLELCYQFRNSVAEAEKQLLMSSRQPSGRLEETEEYCRSFPLYSGQRDDAREKADDDRATETFFESKTSFEELLLTDTVVEDHVVSSNSKLPLNQLFSTETHRSYNDNLGEDRGDGSDDDIIISFENVDRVETPAGLRVDAKFIKCLICGEAFKSAKIFQIHSGLHASNHYYPCCSCNEILRTKRHWRKHRQEHAEENLRITAVNSSFDKSEDKFITQLKLKFNKLCHNSDAEQECIISAEQIRIQKDPNAYQTKTDRAVECTLCKNRFHSDVLEVHKVVCQRQLTTKKNLFSCAYCGKEFDRKLHLTAHIRTHTGERPFSCNLCPQKFRHKRTRNDHLKLHRGECLFKCFICKKTFPRVSGLRGHARVHNSQNTHSVCPVCDEKFETTSMRNHHMAIHPGEKPCQCDYCGIYFRKKGALFRHMGTQHGPIGD